MRAGTSSQSRTKQAFLQVSLPSTKLTCQAPHPLPALLGKVTQATRAEGQGGTAPCAQEKFGLAVAKA